MNSYKSKVYIIFAYWIFAIAGIITEINLTKELMALLTNLSPNKLLEAVCIYQMLYTKLLSLLEVSYVAKLFFSQDISTLVQIFIVKLISILIWLILGLQFSINFYFYFHVIIAFISLCLLFCISYFEYSSIYKNYNRRISYDPALISIHIFLQIVNAIQNATKFFLVMRIIVEIYIKYFDTYSIYTFFKFLTIFIVETYEKREEEITHKVRAYTILYVFFTIGSTASITSLMLNHEVTHHFISFNFELLTLTNFILLLICSFKTKNVYT